MSSNILSVPFRRTHAVSLSTALKQYITEQYDQSPGIFAQDLATIDSLRTEAVTTTEAHNSGIKKISAYAAQLVWMGVKFPMDIGLEFSWFPALGFNTGRPQSSSSLRFELANVMFNLGALYSQLAASLNRSTVEGLKTANSYLCLAAGVFEYIRTDVIAQQETIFPEDINPMTLESLQQLMLAQAQECSWCVAVKNTYKDGLIAKLAAKVSDFYDQAAEFGTKSDSISTEWLHHISAKHHHFAAAAQYRAACDCLEKRKYGEEVARLRDSVVCVNEALKEARWVNKIVLGDLNGLKMRVTEDLKRSEKDNDIIYLHTVPSKSELNSLGRTVMATSKKPQDISDPSTSLGNHGTLGEPLFIRLVPYSVHAAATIYADRRDRMVKASIIDELEAMTNRLKDLLASLNLPGSIQALEQPLGLPKSLIAHANEIRQRQGLHQIRRSLREVEHQKDDDAANYQEGLHLLQTEAAEDEKARMKFGTDRWTRLPSQQAAEHIYKQGEAIKGYFSSASQSDGLIKDKLKKSEAALKVLGGTDRDLEQYVPSSRRAALSPKIEREASQLRFLLDEIGRLEDRRRRKVETLRQKVKADDIGPDILAETARLEREFPMQKIEIVQFEGLSDKRIRRYDEDHRMVATERAEQDQVATQLQEANATFVKAKSGDTSSTEREQALQRLEQAYLQYNEIAANIDMAIKFYSDLGNIVNRFRDESRNFRFQRRAEASQMEEELSNAMSSLNLAKSNDLQDRKERESLRAQYSTKAPSQEPMPAPKPNRAAIVPPAVRSPQPVQAMWNPEMGIKFGSPTRSPEYPNTRSGRWSPGKGVKFS